MAISYTGVRVCDVDKEIIDNLHKNKQIDVHICNIDSFSQNEYLVLKDITGVGASALGRIKGNKICLLSNVLSASGIKPKCKEQVFALDALLDDTVKIVILTGKAGTGKTLLTMAAALQQMDNKKYNKLILTRPMSQVGRYELGILPGEVNDKFLPYLQSYMCNLEFLMGDRESNMQDLIEQYKAQFIPFQLIRGASWHHSWVICDEAQTLDYLETLTLGTRPSEGTKLVILGDLNQRDERIAKEKTGIYKFINHVRAKDSTFVASIELLKSQRGEVATLFSDIFEE